LGGATGPRDLPQIAVGTLRQITVGTLRQIASGPLEQAGYGNLYQAGLEICGGTSSFIGQDLFKKSGREGDVVHTGVRLLAGGPWRAIVDDGGKGTARRQANARQRARERPLRLGLGVNQVGPGCKGSR